MMKHNPLKEYLDKKEITQAEFARRLGDHLGRKSTPYPQISNYVRGIKRPSHVMRVAIASITRGGVPAEAWGDGR